MSSISIIGTGNMASTLAALAVAGGNTVEVIGRDQPKAAELAKTLGGGTTAGEFGAVPAGDIVIVALGYANVVPVVIQYGDALAGKVVVDPTNPLDFTTLDSLVPAGSSAAAELAVRLPGAQVVKAFNTVFAAVLASGTIGARPHLLHGAFRRGDDQSRRGRLRDVDSFMHEELAVAQVSGVDAHPEF